MGVVKFPAVDPPSVGADKDMLFNRDMREKLFSGCWKAKISHLVK